MTALGQHVLLGLSVAALTGVGSRFASSLGTEGLVRIITTATLACAVVAVHALALGLLGLGAAPVALSLAALVTWLATRRLLPLRGRPPRAEASAWWEARSARGRAVAGALTALGLGWALWQLRNPHLTVDGFTYHLGLAGAWFQEGTPGARVDLMAGVPVAAYPVTNEVLVAWAVGLSHSWVAASVWPVALAGLLGASAWTGLRALGVDRRVTGLGVAALLTLPLVAGQLGGPLTDVAALAWLAACAALCAQAARTQRPLLLVPAVVAAGLAFGTKTTPAVLLLAALGFAAWRLRPRLRAVAWPLAGAAVVAALVGGVWSVRNLVLHGSPLWPFVAGPFGDPVPPRLAALDGRFLDAPLAILDGRVHAYLDVLAGGALLLAGALALPLARRSAVALAAGTATAVALVAWGLAPFTGIDEEGLAAGAVRYLLPALGAATLAVCVAAAGAGRRLHAVVVALLAAAVVASVAHVVQAGPPFVPWWPLIAGLLAAGALAGMAVRAPRGVVRGAWVAPALAVLAGAVLAGQADGYVWRHAEAGLPDAGLLRALHGQPAWGAGGGEEIAMAPTVVAVAAGDRLAHPVRYLPAGRSCEAVRARLDRGWVALQHRPRTPEYLELRACLAEGPVWADGTWELWSPTGAQVAER